MEDIIAILIVVVIMLITAIAILCNNYRKEKKDKGIYLKQYALLKYNNILEMIRTHNKESDYNQITNIRNQIMILRKADPYRAYDLEEELFKKLEIIIKTNK